MGTDVFRGSSKIEDNLDRDEESSHVTETNRGILSPNVPHGTEGTKAYGFKVLTYIHIGCSHDAS